MSETLVLDPPATGVDDTAKRRQIVEGARTMFLSRGFDAASMDNIAKAAGVSKGTLYVYFRNKEELFAAIVQQECTTHAETWLELEHSDGDVTKVLTKVGSTLVNFLCKPEKAASLRIVVAIADRMPEIGQVFYETGPNHGIQLLKSYLDTQVKAGILTIPDTEVAAAQFLDACQSTLFKPVLFNFAPPPPPERIAHVVGIAVEAFLAAYRKN